MHLSAFLAFLICACHAKPPPPPQSIPSAGGSNEFGPGRSTFILPVSAANDNAGASSFGPNNGNMRPPDPIISSSRPNMGLNASPGPSGFVAGSAQPGPSFPMGGGSPGRSSFAPMNSGGSPINEDMDSDIDDNENSFGPNMGPQNMGEMESSFGPSMGPPNMGGGNFGPAQQRAPIMVSENIDMTNGNPLGPFLKPLRNFYNPDTGRHFTHAAGGVIRKFAGGTGTPTHRVIPAAGFNRNSKLLLQICPSLTRLNSIVYNGAQMLLTNPKILKRFTRRGWTKIAPAGYCVQQEGQCGATYPLLAGKATKHHDFIHFTSQQEMAQFMSANSNYVDAGHGVICWLWQ